MSAFSPLSFLCLVLLLMLPSLEMLLTGTEAAVVATAAADPPAGPLSSLNFSRLAPSADWRRETHATYLPLTKPRRQVHGRVNSSGQHEILGRGENETNASFWCTSMNSFCCSWWTHLAEVWVFLSVHPGMFFPLLLCLGAAGVQLRRRFLHHLLRTQRENPELHKFMGNGKDQITAITQSNVVNVWLIYKTVIFPKFPRRFNISWLFHEKRWKDE